MFSDREANLADLRNTVLGTGTGRCGTHALALLLDLQHDARVTHEEPPLLPWKPAAQGIIKARIHRLRRLRSESTIGDVASFYLPYAEEAITGDPGVRIVCLKRPREEVVASFCRWLDTVHPLPINHWAERPSTCMYHDPVWTRIFPQYEIQDREEGIRRYWNEYYHAAETLQSKYPQQFRIFGTEEAMNTEDGQRALLSFAEFPEPKQVLSLGRRSNRPDQAQPHSRRTITGSSDARDPRRCIVLVPYTSHVAPDCDSALTELERRGYLVRRVRGFAAIDQGRNQLVTDALVEGYEETLWIDSDIAFDPDAVEQLRRHDEPIVCGIYPQKGRRTLACHVLPGTEEIVFGNQGGLMELRYAGTGFMLVRREVYSDIQRQLQLPVCNEQFGRPMVPFFHPLIAESDDGAWYLAEDYSFCERARRCGYKVLADTSIRLWHIGHYAYGWEDAGMERQRYGTFVFRLT